MIKKIFKVLLKIVIVLVLVVGALLGYLTLMEYNPKPIESIIVENASSNQVTLGETYSFFTFNIGYASLGEAEDFVMDGGTKGRADSKSVVEAYLTGIGNLITTHPSDFYLLQEVDEPSRRSYEIDERATLEALLPTYTHTFAYNFNAVFVPFPVSLTDYIGSVKSGIEVLSNYEIESSERHQFPGAFAWPLRVANLKRAMLVNVLPISNSDKSLVIVNLHMSAYDGDGSLRAQEMAYLKAFMEEQTALGNYVVIGGDFNQTFPSAVGIYPEIEGLYQAYPIEASFLPAGYQFGIDLNYPSCRLLNQPYEPTSPLTQYYIIDGFIVSDNITINSITNLNDEFKYSDHNPITMSVTLLNE